MSTVISALTYLTIILLIGSVIRIHFLRAKIASAVMSEQQFEEFQKEGMAGSGLNDPTRLLFEYRFIIHILSSSDSVDSVNLLKSWIICFRIFLAVIISFAVLSIVLIFLHK